LESL
jgi:uncharacterized SAM-binding protein YcdF (DUF218 family)